MILFLTDQAEGKRGGEETNNNIFKYFRDNYNDVYPDHLTDVIGELKSLRRHSKYKLHLAKEYSPELTIIDISSAFRNLRAFIWLKKRKNKVMAVFLGERMTFSINNFLVKKAIFYCENYILKRSDIICVNSKFLAERVRQRAGGEAKIIIIRPGTKMLPSGTLEVDIEYRNRKKPVRLLFVGACTRVKGLEYLVRSLEYLKDLDLVLHIAGEIESGNRYYQKIVKIIEELRISDRVRFLGFLDTRSLADYYKESSIFVLPSLSEGYGRVLVEALSFGLPVVASNVGAIPELVESNVNAILVEPKNPKALAEAIKKLVENPAQMDEMSGLNFQRSESMQTWDMFMGDLERKLAPVITQLTGLRPKNNRQDARE